ncbi:glutathione peroxidase [Pedobacter sp. MW01-1-1]|uniref:glutathione peroxidase n=1 Tax=Pedobacter sp. MW01-1-1 TaxID=3383027 RepID=UPI003FEF51B4
MNKHTPNIYSFDAKKVNGTLQPLSDFKNKVLLIVNTASECGLTPQLKELQELKDSFNTDDFEILGFPTNDFGHQEPLNGAELTTFCEVNYGVKFPVFEKITVKGDEIDPLFQFLSSKKLNGHLSSKPRWNFHKYLINKQGEVVDYFLPITKPLNSRVKKKIQQLLDEKAS